MNKDKPGIHAKINKIAKSLPPIPNPPQIALIACIGLTAATLGLLIYVASKYDYLKPDVDERPKPQPQNQPIK